jgi:hypothetical protein
MKKKYVRQWVRSFQDYFVAFLSLNISQFLSIDTNNYTVGELLNKKLSEVGYVPC